MIAMQTRLATTLVFSVLISPSCQAQSGTPVDTLHSHLANRPSFAESALARINPSNRDYGARVTQWKAQFAAATVDDLYWWSNCVSLTTLFGLSGFSILQSRASEKKLRIASALIAQLWNGRVSDKVEIERRTAEHNNLVDKHNLLVEDALRAAPAARKRGAAEPGDAGDSAPLAPPPEPEQYQAEERTPPPPAIWQKTFKAPTPPLPEPPSAPTSPAPANLTKPSKRAAPAQAEEQARLSSTGSRQQQTSASASEPVLLKQENKRLQAQVEALNNTQRNLQLRLNTAQQQVDALRDQAAKGAVEESV